MANNESQKLAVDVIARINQLEKSMAKAGQVVDRSTSGMERRLKTFESSAGASFAKVGKLAQASLAGLFAGILGGGIGGLISQVGDIAKGVAEIGDAAKMAGLSFQSFQELRYIAEQNRVGIDSLVDGIKELNLRADEFIVTGGGSASEAFGRLGYSADALKNKLKDPSALFTEIIGKLGQLERSAQIRIADELFGGSGGEKFVQLIDQGEKGIRKTREEAHRLGLIMSDEVIKSADELDKKFNQVANVVSNRLKTAVVEAADAMQRFLDLYAQHEKRMNAVEAGAKMGAMFGAQPDPNRVRTTPKTGRLQEPATPMPSQADLSAKYLADYRAELAKTNTERAVAAEAERILAEAARKGLAVTKEQANALAREKVARDEGEASAKKLSASREKAAGEADRERQAVADLIKELDFEYSLIGKTEAQKAKMNALRQAGAAATTEEQLAISSKVDAIFRESEAYERTQAAAEEARDAARDFAGTLVDGMLNGASATETLGNALRGLASRLLNSGLDNLFSGGGLGGLFGGGGGKGSFPSAPGGLYSEGGYTGDGGKYQPAGVVHKGEYVMDADTVRKAGGPAAMEAMRRGLKGYADGGYVGAMPSMPTLSAPSLPDMKSIMGGGGGGQTVVHFSPTIDARGADQAAVARLEQNLQKMKSEIPAYVEKGIATHRQKNLKVR
ncbi:hypothetical protein [Agrobacterium tumefaciens]|uniref:hypothetical protein n=1 Tax=Agrobacterium tumefaciens TaxID=358 RepID=UPI00224466D7|nr:hypothetical protein [Agrobacterium tumefaciens]MCW8057657.1 hypothetical protein [Agrobacterium tumefaciens]MCW8146937.1 hypothetical protein [Agrobacterium tumefaciens]